MSIKCMFYIKHTCIKERNDSGEKTHQDEETNNRTEEWFNFEKDKGKSRKTVAAAAAGGQVKRTAQGAITPGSSATDKGKETRGQEMRIELG